MEPVQQPRTIVVLLTAGFGLLITWPIPIIWGAIAANNYNKRLLNEHHLIN